MVTGDEAITDDEGVQLGWIVGKFGVFWKVGRS
jgi:hypothetical protein